MFTVVTERRKSKHHSISRRSLRSLGGYNERAETAELIELSFVTEAFFDLFYFVLYSLFPHPPLPRKNVTPSARYNFDTHEPILIIFGRNVTEKARNQKML